jgi:flagellar protein FlaJ
VNKMVLMRRVTDSEKKLVWIVSAILGLTIGLTAVINWLFMSMPLALKTDEILFLALMVALLLPAIINVMDDRWRNALDNAIPNFLRELSEAGRTGVTLTRALELASKRKYGPLSEELDKVVTQISWGLNFNEALERFADRVNTRLARRTASIITEIRRAGGDIRDILEMISLHIGELQTIERERQSQLRLYVVIVYIAFFIFLFVDILLIKTFFTELGEMKTTMAESGGGGLLTTAIDVDRIIQVMYHVTLLEGLFGGLIAGKMGEGKVGAGLKHSLILMAIGFLSFYFIIWGSIGSILNI